MIYARQLLRIAVCAVLLPVAAVCVIAQQGKANAGCSVVNSSLPSVYLTFELSESTDKELHLAFHNNLSCTLTVERQEIDLAASGKLFKRKDIKISEGTTLSEYTLDWSSDKVILPILYDFQDDEAHKAPEPANYWENRDQIFKLDIPPARSVIFGVSPAHLKKGFAVSVQFYYPWEPGPMMEQVVHRVYFSYANLPGSKQRTISQLKFGCRLYGRSC